MTISETLSFVAIDIETTGLSEHKDEIIEIAAIRFQNGVVSDVFDSFVRPHGKVPKFIQYLTHISPEDLRSAPDIKSVLEIFKAFIGDSPLVGHNIGFDLGFINHALVLTGGFPLLNKSWDTAEISRIYLPETPDHKLGTVSRYMGVSLENAHRADADATATGKILVSMSEHIVKHCSLITNTRILGLCKQAQLATNLDHYLDTIIKYQRANALLGPAPIPLKSPRNYVIESNVPAASDPGIDDVFSPDGLFAKRFPNFEFRAGQLDMAKAVTQAFTNEDHLVVEAGTGVGKSFAYLVPAIEFAMRNQSKVVVSTNTKNLQEQLFYKDLPQLKQILPLPFKAVLVKGRENYICRRRWEELVLQSGRELSPWDAHALMYLIIWQSITNTGDVSENSSFDRKRFSITWRKVCSDRYLCGSRKCHYFRDCYVMNLRKHAENASIVVANHALLLADMKMENSTLGEYKYLVIDEAHNLMASASKHLGADLSYADVVSLFNQLCASHRKQKSGFLSNLQKALEKSVLSEKKKEQAALEANRLEQLIDAQRKPLIDLFNLANARCIAADSYNKLRIKDVNDAKDLFDLLACFADDFKEIMKSVQALHNILSSFDGKQLPSYDTLHESLSAFVMRLSEMEEVLLQLLNPDLDNYAMWIENNPKPDRNIPSAVLNYAPIEVSGHLNRMLYNCVPSIVFTSATLALRGSFRYFVSQSGLGLLVDKGLSEVIVESPFDYDKQSKLLITSFLPEPKDRYFQNQAIECLEQVIDTAEVGTMALFTSYRDLDAVYERIAERLFNKKRPFFAQGKGGSRSSILEEFKTKNNGVLLGTSSFWEGVDVQGDSLSFLILYKIPFQVPSEPIVEAYIDKLERDNKDSFMHYMLPNALLRLRQGFGRLIRSKRDRGIVLIMDSRVSNKSYGHYFKEILPGKHVELRDEIQLLAEVSTFFGKL